MKVKKCDSVINGWMNIYAQYGWQIMEPDGSLSPFDPCVVRYADKLGRLDEADGILSVATFYQQGIEIYDVDDYGRRTESMFREYEVLVDAVMARV